MSQSFHRLAVTVVVLFLATLVVSGDHRRHSSGGRPPSSFGRRTHHDPWGQQQNEEWSGQRNQPLEYGGIPVSDENDEGIQQVNVDEDVEEFLVKPQRTTTTTTEAPKAVAYTRSRESPEAVTPKGTFVGLRKKVGGKDVYVFYGIPFAKPPLGPLRFKRPVMAPRIREPFNATIMPNACSQTIGEVFNDFPGEKMWFPNTKTSEDCLYLNIWVPATIFEEKETTQVPVIFWIFGGGFFSGSNSLPIYDGAKLAASQDLVVVSPQYRLGPLGFLYLGTDDAPGNMGLIDQALALQWTRENIEYFGGNPSVVTATGESCGAASVGYHLISPISKNYIKRAIMSSGLPGTEYSFQHPAELKERSLSLAKNAGCSQKDLREIVECLQNVSVDKLNALQWKEYKHMLDFPFTPTIDGYFLPDYPEEIIRKGKAKRAEVMLGTVRDEGTYFILYHYINYLSHLKSTSIPYDRFVEMMNELLYGYSENEKEAIITEYTNWVNPEDGYANLRNLGEAIGDMWFVCNHRHFADVWANRGLSVYYYHFTERFSTNDWGKWMGVMHGDDVPLIFGNELGINHNHTPAETQMIMHFMRMVGDFARTGVPSNKWERYTSEHPVYLDVNATVLSDATTPDKFGPNADRCAFWNGILPHVRRNEQECKNNNMPMQQPPRQSEFGGGGGSIPQQQQMMPTQPSRPQWNSNGQGIHGGQGFSENNLNPQNQHTPQNMQMMNQHPACSVQYQTTHFCPANFGCSPPPPQQPAAVPTETSCRCSVNEEGSNSETEQEQTTRRHEFQPPPPAVY